MSKKSAYTKINISLLIPEAKKMKFRCGKCDKMKMISRSYNAKKEFEPAICLECYKGLK